jgi:hypothetical protein
MSDSIQRLIEAAEAAEARLAQLDASKNKRPLTGPQPVDWREFAAMQKQLDNLLSRIHGGGQYQKEHGTAKAVADAHDIVAQLLADRDVLAAEVEAWRHNERVVKETFPGQEQRFVAMMVVKHAKEHTNSTGALKRAKETK